MTALTKPHISELELESSTLALWAEFLAGFFDGDLHDVGANAAVKFPKCTFSFQQAELPQPMNLPDIALIWSAPSSVEKRWELVDDVVQQMAYTRARFTFMVRAAAKSNADGNAKALCIEAAQKLLGLLGNAKATQPLAQLGIRRLRPNTPQSLENALHVMRRLEVGAQLRYPILSQV